MTSCSSSDDGEEEDDDDEVVESVEEAKRQFTSILLCMFDVDE